MLEVVTPDGVKVAGGVDECVTFGGVKVAGAEESGVTPDGVNVAGGVVEGVTPVGVNGVMGLVAGQLRRSLLRHDCLQGCEHLRVGDGMSVDGHGFGPVGHEVHHQA